MHDAIIKVLIVDDEAQFRATTKKILDREGFSTIVAADGAEALNKVKENPDVIILDIRMPGMDGLTALKKIQEAAPKIPVIMLTGHGGEDSAKEALEMGAYDYLAKPCAMDLLAAKIRDAHYHGGHDAGQEKCVRDLMIPISAYSTLPEEASVGEAVHLLVKSFTARASTNRIAPSAHQSLLVLSGSGEVQGALTIPDLINALMPAYLSAPKPSTADAIEYSPMFWRGIFSRSAQDLAKEKIMDIMGPAPDSAREDANLMEAAYIMITRKTRILVVMRGTKPVGVIRQQDLLFEMERAMRV